MTNPEINDAGRFHVARPDVPKRKSVVVRFFEKVRIDPGGCWFWTGWVEANGYGGFRHGETNWAHRASYLLFRGPIPDGLVIDHLCYEQLCVNPDHLEAVTHEENKRRATGGWSECDSIHPGTPSRVGHKGSRTYCKECHRMREVDRRARRAAENSGMAAPRLPLEEKPRSDIHAQGR